MRVLSGLLHIFVWLGRHEVSLLVALGAVSLGVWAFVELAGEVVEGGTERFDRTILLAMRNPQDVADPIGGPGIEEMARDVTAMGGIAVLTALTIAVGGFLLLGGKVRMALFLWAAVGGGVLTSSLLKSQFDRPRPELTPHGSYVYTASFPSGHSMMSAVVYLTLGALLARSEKRKRLKAYLLLTSAALTFAVGVSRVYLGVHWPTDVLAGWTAGTVWALLCWLAAKWLQGRRKLERESEQSPVVADAV